MKELKYKFMATLQDVINETLKSGQTSIDAFYANAQKAGIQTNPEINKMFAESRANYQPVNTGVVNRDLSNTSPDFMTDAELKQAYSLNPQNNEVRTAYESKFGNEAKIANNLASSGIVSSSLPQMTDYANLVSDTEEQALRDKATEREAELARIIGGEYDVAISERKKRGEKQLGGAEAQMGITRGLGASSSRMQFMADLSNQIQGDIDLLTKQKADAITKMKFEQADAIDARIQKLEETRYKVQQDAYNNSLKLLQEQREQGEYESKEAEKNVETAASAILGSLTGDNEEDLRLIQEMSTQYGVDPNQLIAKVNELSSEQSKFDLEQTQKIINIQNDLAEGETYTMPDGTVIEGKKKDKPDIVSITKTIGNNEFRYEYKRNPDTLELEQIGQPVNLGPKYKGDGGGDNYETIKTNLEKTKGVDGYVNTDTYKQERMKASDKTTFDKNFSWMLNPNDPIAKQLIPKTGNLYDSL